MQAIGTVLIGIAAIAALWFTGLSVRATNGQLQETRQQLQIDEQGQITDRYNAAITNLGSPSVDVRLGGIYALQRIVQDSPRDQPTVVAVLCAFVRDHGRRATAKPGRPSASPLTSSAPTQPPTDIQAALTVVGTRNTAHDGSTTVDFTGMDLSHADLSRANLTGANLFGVDLTGADLAHAGLSHANLYRANLTGADLSEAKLSGAYLDQSDLTGAYLIGAKLSGGQIVIADLSSAELADADLSHANLFRANLTGADLAGADLAGAQLSGAQLSGATLDRSDLTGAVWPIRVPVPEGWKLDTGSDRLERAVSSPG